MVYSGSRAENGVAIAISLQPIFTKVLHYHRHHSYSQQIYPPRNNSGLGKAYLLIFTQLSVGISRIMPSCCLSYNALCWVFNASTARGLNMLIPYHSAELVATNAGLSWSFIFVEVTLDNVLPSYRLL